MRSELNGEKWQAMQSSMMTDPKIAVEGEQLTPTRVYHLRWTGPDGKSVDGDYHFFNIDAAKSGVKGFLEGLIVAASTSDECETILQGSVICESDSVEFVEDDIRSLLDV